MFGVAHASMSTCMLDCMYEWPYALFIFVYFVITLLSYRIIFSSISTPPEQTSSSPWGGPVGMDTRHCFRDVQVNRRGWPLLEAPVLAGFRG